MNELLGRRLLRERGRRGLSQEAVARLIGVSLNAYVKLEKGKSEPRYSTWKELCRLYGWPHPFLDDGGYSSDAATPEYLTPAA
jgi:transcriptional regulator with XRE-family HTH domain